MSVGRPSGLCEAVERLEAPEGSSRCLVIPLESEKRLVSDGALLGAERHGATELIHIGQAVLGLGGGLEPVLPAAFNYPTLAECCKIAALDVFNELA